MKTPRVPRVSWFIWARCQSLQHWIILVFCDKLGILYFWSLFKAAQYDSRVLHILTSTEDTTHEYCISSRVLRMWLRGTAYPHGYWGYDLRVLRIWLTGTEDMTHGYCISTRVLRIWLTGTEVMTHEYCICSQVLKIWLRGTAYPHGYWWYDSRVLHIFYTGWSPIHCCKLCWTDFWKRLLVKYTAKL